MILNSERRIRGRSAADDLPNVEAKAGDEHFAAIAANAALSPPTLVTAPTAPGIAPNFFDFIRLSGNYSVAAGTLLYGKDLPYLFTGDGTGFGHHSFVNDGTMWSLGKPGIVLYGMPFDVVNSGMIVARSTEAYDAFAIFGAMGIQNSGSIYAVADASFAGAIRDWDAGALIVNSGLIAALSLWPEYGVGYSTARAVQRFNGGRLVNEASGQILAEGVAALGLKHWRGHVMRFGDGDYYDIDNAGTVEARSLNPSFASTAIALESLEGEIMRVRNSGTIRGDIAIDAYGQIAIGDQREKTIVNLQGGLIDGAVLLSLFHEMIDNSGRIEGDVDMADGNDLLWNRGSVTGLVDLGAGADFWLGSGGVLTGEVLGGEGGDGLFGSDGVDTLNGEAGDDVISGGGGADRLDGGAGADVFVYKRIEDSTAAAFDVIAGFTSGVDRIDLSALSPQQITIQPGAGTSLLSVVTAAGTLVVQVSGSLSQSDLILSPIPNAAGTAGADRLHATAAGSALSGAAGDDVLIGGDGNDRLDGGTGADVLWGGAGDDIYVLDTWLDTIWELEGMGHDTIELHHHNYFYMPATIEDIVSFDEYSYVYGNDLANRMTGNDATNTFLGGRGDDVIDGRGGDDILYGNAGVDQLTGGGGADLFIFQALSDSRAMQPPRSDGKKSAPDVITDFASGQDKIDLRGIDAIRDVGLQADHAFTFIGTNAFTNVAGQLRYEVRDGFAHIYGDVNGDGLADMQIVARTSILVATDFLL